MLTMRFLMVSFVSILSVFFTGTCGQSFASFRTFASSFACTQRDVVEQDVDTIGVEAVLDLSKLFRLANMWSYLDIVAPRRKMAKSNILLTVYLPTCSTQTPGIHVNCFNYSQLVTVTVHLKASRDLNKTTMFAVWKTKHSNFITSFHEPTPYIVTQHIESFRVNNVETDLSRSVLKLPVGNKVDIDYCVRNLDKHKMRITVVKNTVTASNKDCLTYSLRNTYKYQLVLISYEEIAGQCRRTGSYRIETIPNTQRATSDGVRVSPSCYECRLILFILTAFIIWLTTS